jgi:hypothetical protein
MFVPTLSVPLNHQYQESAGLISLLNRPPRVPKTRACWCKINQIKHTVSVKLTSAEIPVLLAVIQTSLI